MSKQYPGGLITKTPVIPSGPYETSTASGIWTLDQQAAYAKQGIWPTAGNPGPDAQFNYVTMLLHGDGTNGAQNNTFIDSSTNNFTITRNGNTTQGSFSPYGSNWSNYFDGSTGYLSMASNAALNFGTGDATVEFWFNGNTASLSYPGIFSSIDYNSAGSASIRYNNTGYANKVFMYINTGGDPVISSTSTIAFGVWAHIAIVRQSTSLKLYLNGVLDTTVTISSGLGFNLSNGGTRIGRGFDVDGANGYFTGYLSNLRAVKGTAVYTSNFTPSTTPLTAISGTSLLTCQSNRFIDNSSNALAITRTGLPSVQRFNPFGTSTAYSTSVIGGSGYFDGSGDYLETPSSSQFTAAGDFTVSCWFYLQSFANAYYVVGGNWSSSTSDEWLIQVASDGSIRFLTTASTSFSSAGVVKLNQWTYFTATRSGTTVTVQVNGSTVSTYTKSDTLGAANKTIYIGRQASGDWAFNGYITDFRLLSGSAITTIPTAPVSSTSTGLLLSMTNAAILDQAMMNDLETVGNAQISTSVKKYGTGSMYFDGSAYLFEPSNQANTLGAGDFTMEAWIYPIGVNGSICEKGYGLANGFLFWYQSGQIRIRTYNGSSTQTNIFASGVINTDVWQHVAAVRYSGTITLYVNGTSVASGADTDNLSSTDNFQIGAYDGYTLPVQGYIDDLRITKYARYTANFTPPTAAFPNIGPT